MKDTRRANGNWTIKTNADGSVSNEHAQLAVLMDIRDELQILNKTLKGIRRNTAKPRKPKSK